jgi:hypothetical protein
MRLPGSDFEAAVIYGTLAKHFSSKVRFGIAESRQHSRSSSVCMANCQIGLSGLVFEALIPRNDQNSRNPLKTNPALSLWRPSGIGFAKQLVVRDPGYTLRSRNVVDRFTIIGRRLETCAWRIARCGPI